MTSNLSPDLIWEITKPYNSYQVKRRTGGGVTFTHDPHNLTNKQTRKHHGLAHDKAIGIAPGPNGGLTLTTKKGGKSHTPGAHQHSSTIGGRKGTGSRKAYRSVTNSTTKRDYRSDLHQTVIARSSAILNSQRVKKDKPAPKPRGAKAKAAAEAS